MRRRAMLLIVAMVAALVVGSGVALAKAINGNDRDNVLFGTQRADTIRGFGGEDVIFGQDGGDTLIGGRGQDEVFGGNDNDEIKAVDGSEDLVFCGLGRDRVRANPGDDLFNCERVVRDGPRVGDTNLINWSKWLNLYPDLFTVILQEGSTDTADELERIEAMEKEE
jgi:RTX calcium-binding nonapeptide repeat (4 copies)